MPKYQICCSTTTYHYAVVEAPNAQAATDWYHNHSDGSEFTSLSDSSLTWEYVNTETAEDIYNADVTVDENGKPIKEV